MLNDVVLRHRRRERGAYFVQRLDFNLARHTKFLENFMTTHSYDMDGGIQIPVMTTFFTLYLFYLYFI
jgi:hypothetical protein